MKLGRLVCSVRDELWADLSHSLALKSLPASLFEMKKPILWMAVALTPLLLINPASADEPQAPVVKAAAEAKIPTLTYYYFDG